LDKRIPKLIPPDVFTLQHRIRTVKIPHHVDRQSLLPDEKKYSLVRLNFYEHPF
jgi:hypothetical protein